MPPKAGKVFVVTTEDVWKLHGEKLRAGRSQIGRTRSSSFPGGEPRKRLAEVEALAEQMIDGRAATGRAS